MLPESLAQPVSPVGMERANLALTYDGRPYSPDLSGRGLLLLAPVGLVVSGAAAWAASLRISPLALFSPYQSFPLVSASAIITVLATLRYREIFPVSLLGIILELARVALLLMQGSSVLASWSTFGQGLWYASVFVALWQVWRSPADQRWYEFDRLLLRVALPLGVALSMFGLGLTSEYIPVTFDNFLYAFDGLLGAPVATFIAELCRHSSTLWVVTVVAYQSFWVVLAVFIFVLCRTDQRMAVELMGRWILVGLLGWLLYFALPGVGPNVAFWDVYGNELPLPNDVSLAKLVIDRDTPRNALPSLHMSWALLLAMAGRQMGTTWARLGLAFVFVTAFATLGLREHYLIDLIVAVPFTVSVYALPSLFRRDDAWKERLAASVGGAGMTAFLLLTIRFGTGALRDAPWIGVVLVVAIVLVAVILHLRSEHREDAALFEVGRGGREK